MTFAFVLADNGFAVCAEPGGLIHRLDGSTITIAEAESFAVKSLRENHVTGAQLVILNHGQVAWKFAYGLRRKEPELPMTTETTTWAASITKSVFSTYVMQLVERGEFDLDAPIASQLSQPLDNYEAYRFSASELVKDPQWASVTPRMLLAHSSGLLNFASMEPGKKLRLHFKPGSRFNYSGEGINLVQFVIEQKMGKSLDQLMQDAIFDQLGMMQSGLIYRKEFEANVADRYDMNEKLIGQTKRFPARGAGSMATSAEDLARFDSALLAGKIISHATMEAMFKPYLRLTSFHQFESVDTNSQGNEASEVGLAYGVGWGLLTRTRFGPAFFKEGHGDGAQNYMICFEQSKACMILLTNSDNGELAFRPLLEKIFGDTVTPWEWEGYTPAYIAESRKHP